MKTADFVGKCHGREVITEVWYTHRIDVLTRHGLRTNLGTTIQASYRPRLVSDCLLNGKPDKSTQYIRQAYVGVDNITFVNTMQQR